MSSTPPAAPPPSSSSASASASASSSGAQNKKKKVKVKLVAVGNAPLLKRSKFLVAADDEIFKLLKQIRAWLNLKDSDQSLFLYINSCFAPSLDQLLGELHECFSVSGELIVNYSLTAAYG